MLTKMIELFKQLKSVEKFKNCFESIPGHESGRLRKLSHESLYGPIEKISV